MYFEVSDSSELKDLDAFCHCPVEKFILKLIQLVKHTYATSVSHAVQFEKGSVFDATFCLSFECTVERCIL